MVGSHKILTAFGSAAGMLVLPGAIGAALPSCGGVQTGTGRQGEAIRGERWE